MRIATIDLLFLPAFAEAATRKQARPVSDGMRGGREVAYFCELLRLVRKKQKLKK